MPAWDQLSPYQQQDLWNSLGGYSPDSGYNQLVPQAQQSTMAGQPVYLSPGSQGVAMPQRPPAQLPLAPPGGNAASGGAPRLGQVSSQPLGPNGWAESSPGQWTYTGGSGQNTPYSSSLNGIEASGAAGPQWNSGIQWPTFNNGGGQSAGGINLPGGIYNATQGQEQSPTSGFQSPQVTSFDAGGSAGQGTTGSVPALSMNGGGSSGPPSQVGYTEINPGQWVYTGGGGPNVPYSSTLNGIEAGGGEVGAGGNPSGNQATAASMFNLGSLPTVPNTFDPAFEHQYGVTTDAVTGKIGGYWNNAPFGTMNAAQMNTGQVPQVQAQTPQSFAALQQLLSGQGFDPATLARMKANATDQISQSAAGTMSAARLAAERAGLLNSGLGIGLQGNVANQAGIQQGQALNNIDIQNAMQGIQNLTTGAGMQLNLNENSAAQANQVALQNAANLFSSMTQNLANQQATNAANFAGQQQRALGQAQAQSGAMTNSANNWQNAQTQQYYGANVNNANNANQQWTSAGNWLSGLANSGNPGQYAGANAANAGNVSGTSPLGTAASGFGAGATGRTAAGNNVSY